MTTVGVVVAVFNGAATIDAALASIAAQTRLPETVVVVDDGSTDDSVERVERWRGLLPIDLVRFETNRGVAEARTAAVRRLKTDVVVSLDADDFWLPHHLRLLLEAYTRHNGIVTPTAVPWVPDSRAGIDWSRTLQNRPRRRDLSSLLPMNWIFSGAMFPRSSFDLVGAEYRSAPAEDWDLWLRLLRAGLRPTVVDEPTVLYRLSSSSLSADDRGLPSEISVLENFVDETSDARLQRVARRSLRHRRARTSLRESYAQAQSGNFGSARRHALLALRGPRNVALRATAVAIAPKFVVHQRARRRSGE